MPLTVLTLDGQVKVHLGCAQAAVQRDIQHFKVEPARHLGKILSGDVDPLVAILDQPAPTASETGEVFAEVRDQAVVPCGVQFDVLVEQLTNPTMAVLLHVSRISLVGRALGVSAEAQQ